MPSFTKTIKPGKGLRPSKRSPRNKDYLVTCAGMVGRDGVLQAIDELTRMDTSAASFTFPYPQVFVLNRMTLVFSGTVVYEWESFALVEKLTVTEGGTWSVLDGHEYIYASNGMVSIERNPDSKVWALSDQPIASAICNFNGQCIIGSPGVEIT